MVVQKNAIDKIIVILIDEVGSKQITDVKQEVKDQ